jgi:hypothetical protein
MGIQNIQVVHPTPYTLLSINARNFGNRDIERAFSFCRHEINIYSSEHQTTFFILQKPAFKGEIVFLFDYLIRHNVALAGKPVAGTQNPPPGTLAGLPEFPLAT